VTENHVGKDRMKRLALICLFLVAVGSFAFAPAPRLHRAERTRLALSEGRQRGDCYQSRTRRRYQKDSYRGKQRYSPSPEYQRALDVLQTDDRCVLDAALLSRLTPREQANLIKESERSERYNVILELAERNDASRTVFEAAIVALSGSPKYRPKVLELCEKNPRHSLSSNTCAALFQSVSSASEAARLMDFLQSLNATKNAVNTVQVWNAAFSACRQSQHDDNWQTSLSMLRVMKRRGVVPNERTYGHVLYACAQSGQVRIALSLLQELQQQQPSTQVSPQIWGAALHACAKAADASSGLEDALSMLQYMTRQNIQVNTIHVSAFLSACAKAARDDIAQQVLECFRYQQVYQLPKYNLTIQPVPLDLVVVNTVLLACAKAGNYTAAKDILEELKGGDFENVEPDAISYNTVLSACNDPDEAKVLVKEVCGLVSVALFKATLSRAHFFSHRCVILDGTDTEQYLLAALPILTPSQLVGRLQMWIWRVSFWIRHEMMGLSRTSTCIPPPFGVVEMTQMLH